MIWRVTWTGPSDPFPAWADFRYRRAALDYAALREALGDTDVEIIAINEGANA